VILDVLAMAPAASTERTRCRVDDLTSGADVDLLIGNGYADGHATLALDLVRQSPVVRSILERRLGLA
jgi:hypothetical protein